MKKSAIRALAALRTLNDGTHDRDALLGWGGWGALAPAFSAVPEKKWATVADELDTLVPEADLDVARDYLDTSFFTPNSIIDACFEILREAGFTGGSILEPGCGSGRFMARTPDDMTIQWTGVEIDPTAARIAQALNPAADIINAPLEKHQFVAGTFDAAIGNVPFGNGAPFDPGTSASSLHQYFTKRSIDAVREGGYVILVTSRHLMDADWGGIESALCDESGPIGKLVGAIRLPAGTFRKEGTEVVADIIVAQKSAGTPLPEYRRSAVTDRETDIWVAPVSVSSYWTEHPEHVAGTMYATGNVRDPLTVKCSDPETALAAAVDSLRDDIEPMTGRSEYDPAADLADVVTADDKGRPEGSFHIVDGGLFEVSHGKLTPARESKELRALVALRDAAETLLALEADPDLPDSAIAGARQAAREQYEAYTKKFGALNRGTMHEGKPDPETGEITRTWRRPSLGGFRRDPGYTNVMALELFDQNDGVGRPAPILLHRVNKRPEPVTSADSVEEAIAVSLGEGRGVDLDRIASLIGASSRQEAIDAAGELIFHDGNAWVHARDYLAGNIREKLAHARSLAGADARYEVNVTALETVLPADLDQSTIRVALGAPWVEASDIEQFSREVLGCRTTIKHTPAQGIWEIDNKKYATASAEANLAYGTSRMGPIALLDHALNGSSPTVYDESYNQYGNISRVKNTSETIAAEEKLRSLDDRFSVWVWEDAGRAARIAAEFNTRFNSHVIRRADGSYLTFPGLSADVAPWQQQHDAVDRIISTERALIGHPVGSGKTLSMLLGAMTLRRFGLSTKPLIVVPNHLLDQVSREAQQAFPTGRFLIAAKEDLVKDRRRLFAARCATGDWDAVIMTHQAFTGLPLSPEIEERWVQEQKATLRAQMTMSDDRYGSGKGAKAVARAVRSLDKRLAELRHGVGEAGQVTFDHLGVDYLMIDEAHLMRRLATGSTSRDNGFNSGSSKRATDLLLKIDTLASRHPGKPIVSLFTGTPWSNTLAETWVWQRYLQPGMLEHTGTMSFDAWVAAFIRYEANIEVTPDGNGFRVQRRPVGVKNWQQLRRMLWSVADIISAESIGLERPEHDTHTQVSQPAPTQKRYVTWLATRADNLRNSRDTDDDEFEAPVNDSMLLVCGDGRKVALDPALVGIRERSQKLMDAARAIARIHHENADRRYGDSTALGSLQLVLLDLGTPHPDDAQSYGRLRNALIGLGVPADRIRFVHEAKTDRARAALFAQCREGQISVLFGSTSKVGFGTNIQHRLVALHHIDAPWTTADVEQRNGRILRPGNANKRVDIFRYVVEGSFDAYTWQLLERKAKAFERLYDDSETVTELEDFSAATLSYGEVKALAAGNPLLLDQAKAQAELKRLQLTRATHMQQVNRARQNADKALHRASAGTQRAKTLRQAAESGFNADSLTDAVVIRIVDAIARPQERGRYVSPATQYIGSVSLSVAGTWVTVNHNYRELSEFAIPKKVLRTSHKRIGEFIRREIMRVFETATERAAALDGAAARDRELSRAETAAADAAVFEQQAELDTAIAKLARIETLIQTEAESYTGAAAA